MIRSRSIRLTLERKFGNDPLVISSLRTEVIFEGIKVQIKSYQKVNSLLIEAVVRRCSSK